MEKLKFALFSIVTLSLLGLFGYWSISTIQSGSQHVNEQKVRTLEKENTDLKKEVQDQKDEINDLKAELEKSTANIIKEPEPTATLYKYQSLIDELQKIVNAKIILKQKSTGGRVGTIQKFLNIYNKTSIQVDNDYGVGTVKAVTAFQKAEGLTANGEVGTETLNAMIDWLKKQQ